MSKLVKVKCVAIKKGNGIKYVYPPELLKEGINQMFLFFENKELVEGENQLYGWFIVADVLSENENIQSADMDEFKNEAIKHTNYVVKADDEGDLMIDVVNYGNVLEEYGITPPEGLKETIEEIKQQFQEYIKDQIQQKLATTGFIFDMRRFIMSKKEKFEEIKQQFLN